MKYIIIESKLDEIIYKYINSLDELKNLEEFDCSSFDYDLGHSVDAYCYQTTPHDNPVLEYFPYPTEKEPEMEDYYLDYLPAIQIDDIIKNRLNGFFGENWHKSFQIWFEDNYKLPIKTIF